MCHCIAFYAVSMRSFDGKGVSHVAEAVFVITTAETFVDNSIIKKTMHQIIIIHCF